MIFTLLAAFLLLLPEAVAGHLEFFDESGISGWSMKQDVLEKQPLFPSV